MSAAIKPLRIERGATFVLAWRVWEINAGVRTLVSTTGWKAYIEMMDSPRGRSWYSNSFDGLGDDGFSITIASGVTNAMQIRPDAYYRITITKADGSSFRAMEGMLEVR